MFSALISIDMNALTGNIVCIFDAGRHLRLITPGKPQAQPGVIQIRRLSASGCVI
jgi:hypothetical protein